MLVDLVNYNCLVFSYVCVGNVWFFIKCGCCIEFILYGNMQFSDGEVLCVVVVVGLGLVCLVEFQVCVDLEVGCFVFVLEDYNLGEIEDIYVVYVGQGVYLLVCVWVFFDFLVVYVKVVQVCVFLCRKGVVFIFVKFF